MTHNVAKPVACNTKTSGKSHALAVGCSTKNSTKGQKMNDNSKLADELRKVHAGHADEGPSTFSEAADALEAAQAEIEQYRVDCREAIRERDAALARLAELTKQEPVGYVAKGFLALGEGRMCKQISEYKSDTYVVPVYGAAGAKETNALIDKLTARLAEVEGYKDGAYTERNKLVALLSKLFPSGTQRTAIEGWSEDWHGCVYIDLPTGQASWHYHDSQAHLFAHLAEYLGTWDGHTTEQKYERIAGYAAAGASPLTDTAAIDAGCRYITPLLTQGASPVQPAKEHGRTNSGDETGGTVERFGWDISGAKPVVIPATNGAYVWYSDYLKLWKSVQPSQAQAALDAIIWYYENCTGSDSSISAFRQMVDRVVKMKPNFCESCAMDIATCDCVTPRPATVTVQPSQGLQSVADALTIEQLNDKVARLMTAQPSQAPTCDLRGIDAGPLSEWVDLVRRGYVAKDECLIAVKDVPKWLAQNQPSQADAQDAARYRWLREYLPSDDLQYDDNLVLAKTGEDIDAAIDAAINAKETDRG